MADVGRLSSAVGQATGQVLQIMQKEKARELRQAEIDSANNIINKALSLDKNLTSNDITPFVRQQKVFEFIAGEERKTGLPTGSALSSYKQFFGLAKSGAGSGDISKWHKKEMGDAGVLYINPNNPEQRKFVEYDREIVNYRNFIDEEKAFSKSIVDTLTEYGALNDIGPKKLKAFGENPWLAHNDPVAGPILEQAKQQNLLEKKTEENANLTELDKFKNVQNLKESKVNEFLFNFVERMVGKAQENKDLTIAEINAGLDKQIGNWINKSTPESFDKVSGGMVDVLRDYIKNTHPSTRFRDVTGQLKDKQDYVDRENAILTGVAKNLAYKRDPSVVKLSVVADMLRDLDWNTLTQLQVGTNRSAGDWIGDMTGAVLAGGTQSFQRNVKAATTRTAKMVTELDVDSEDFNFAEDDAFDYVRDLIIMSNNPNADPVGIAGLNKSIDWIRVNPKQKEKINNALDEYIKTLDLVNPQNAVFVEMINNFRTALNRK